MTTCSINWHFSVHVLVIGVKISDQWHLLLYELIVDLANAERLMILACWTIYKGAPWVTDLWSYNLLYIKTCCWKKKEKNTQKWKEKKLFNVKSLEENNNVTYIVCKHIAEGLEYILLAISGKILESISKLEKSTKMFIFFSNF